jgi:hypothetical protein
MIDSAAGAAVLSSSTTTDRGCSQALEDRTHRMAVLLLTSNHELGVQAEMLRSLSPAECARLLREQHRLPQASRQLVVERSAELLMGGVARQL